MSIETTAEVLMRLAARKLGIKYEPLPVDSSATSLDVENAFMEDLIKEAKPATKSRSYPTFDSEPE